MAASGSARLQSLRSAVAEAVERSSLRRVAVAVGMSHTGLLAILEGGVPRPSTLRKLEAWYIRQSAGTHEVDAATAASALALLLDGIPKKDLPAVRDEIRGAVREAFRVRRLEPPGWLGKPMP